MAKKLWKADLETAFEKITGFQKWPYVGIRKVSIIDQSIIDQGNESFNRSSILTLNYTNTSYNTNTNRLYHSSITSFGYPCLSGRSMGSR